MNISWTEKKSNAKVLIMVSKNIELLESFDNRRGKMVHILIRYDNLLKTISTRTKVRRAEKTRKA